VATSLFSISIFGVDKNDEQRKGYPKSSHNFWADFIKPLYILIASKRSKIRGNFSSGPSLFMRYMADRPRNRASPHPHSMLVIFVDRNGGYGGERLANPEI